MHHRITTALVDNLLRSRCLYSIAASTFLLVLHIPAGHESAILPHTYTTNAMIITASVYR
jgi:hypothetical protein